MLNETPAVVQRKKHGTRSCYVGGCRCDECRRANTAYAVERERRARELAKGVQVEAATRRRVKVCFGTWTTVKKRCCMGVDGEGCPSKSSLRKDSVGNLCEACRGTLISRTKWVSAERARAHLKRLSRMGIGKRTVSDASHVALSVVQEVGAGRRTRISPETESAILAIDQSAMNGKVLLKAEPYWRLVGDLVDAGLTFEKIAHEMGYEGRSIQMRYDYITASKARRLELVHKKHVMDGHLAVPEELTLEELPETVRREEECCGDCGLCHGRAHRLKILARMLPCTLQDICDAYPCLYPRGEQKDVNEAPRMLYRDLHDLGAAPDDGLWDVKHQEIGNPGHDVGISP